MTFITYMILLTSLLLGVLVSVGVRAEDSSTYNFYFQKAPGPVTVNQGGNVQQPATPGAAVVAAPATSTVVIAPDESSGRKSFFLSMGYAVSAGFTPATRYENVSMKRNEYLGGQFALKGELDLTERLSLTGEVYKLKREVGLDGGTPFYHADHSVSNPQINGTPGTSAKNVLDFSVGGAIHLARLKATTFSLTGGFQTLPYIRYANTRPSAGGGFAEARSVDHEKTYFVGARVRLLADNVWGLDLSYKALPSAGLSMAQLGLVFAL